MVRLPPQQRQHVLRAGVGLGEDRRIGLHEDLRPRQGGGFLGEVGVADGALAGRDVFQCNRQAVDVRFQHVLLERSQAPPQRGDLPDCGREDLLRLDRVAADERVRAAAGQRRQVAHYVVAQLGRRHRVDADVHLALAGHLRANLELRTAAGDLEARLAVGR